MCSTMHMQRHILGIEKLDWETNDLIISDYSLVFIWNFSTVFIRPIGGFKDREEIEHKWAVYCTVRGGTMTFPSTSPLKEMRSSSAVHCFVFLFCFIFFLVTGHVCCAYFNDLVGFTIYWGMCSIEISPSFHFICKRSITTTVSDTHVVLI